MDIVRYAFQSVGAAKSARANSTALHTPRPIVSSSLADVDAVDAVAVGAQLTWQSNLVVVQAVIAAVGIGVGVGVGVAVPVAVAIAIVIAVAVTVAS